MTAQEIGKKINPDFPDVYTLTNQPTELMMMDGNVKVGYFIRIDESHELAKENIFTFVEFGENAQKFRATGDNKYVTYIEGIDILDVVYPAKSPVLAERINSLKIKWGKQNEEFWIKYKQEWINSIQHLVSAIVYRWLRSEEEAGILKTDIINVQKYDAYIGQHINTRLEITFLKGGIVVLDPVSPITSEYDGRADLYILGSSMRTVFLRQYIDNQEFAWVIANTTNRHEDHLLHEASFKSILKQWGYLS
jgi:hypothetical protein